jgi:hypothetical protein
VGTQGYPCLTVVSQETLVSPTWVRNPPMPYFLNHMYVRKSTGGPPSRGAGLACRVVQLARLVGLRGLVLGSQGGYLD